MAKSFGTYEGTAAVWNALEAWSLSNGVWHPFEAFAAWQECRVLSEAEFTARFPGALATLPKEAFA